MYFSYTCLGVDAGKVGSPTTSVQVHSSAVSQATSVVKTAATAGVVMTQLTSGGNITLRPAGKTVFLSY